jgi:PTH1 family peptidyl-tRNA hydrolase
MASPRYVVGLGNPGERYAHTRHNFGFLCVEHFFKRHGGKRQAPHPLYESALCRLGSQEVLLVKPRTFMNESGEAVAALDVEEGESLTVVHDDLDLRFGILRLKQGGGDGGHKGVHSITESLQTDDFTRLRLGIRRADKPADATEFVLENFLDEEAAELPRILDRSCDAIEVALAHGVREAMNRFNERNPETLET